jgi:hypothetical protein
MLNSKGSWEMSLLCAKEGEIDFHEQQAARGKSVY